MIATSVELGKTRREGARDKVPRVTPAEARALFAFDRWANARLIAAASTLPRDLLERDLGVSYRSIFGTLRHILWGDWLWLRRWPDRKRADSDPLACQDLAELQARWSEIESEQREFVERVTPALLERRITYENPPGTPWIYSLEQMMQHVVNHSTYHRGQVAGMLRQLGVAPPPTDYLVYFDELAAQPDA
jgi:uncharacterized damage-inducible protein DinB